MKREFPVSGRSVPWFSRTVRIIALLCIGATGVLAACSGSGNDSVRVQFAIDREGADSGSAQEQHSIQDLRFYLHDVELLDKNGAAYPVMLSVDSQWQSESVALIDLIGTADHDRNTDLQGVLDHAPRQLDGIRFSVGVPFVLNHANPLSAAAPLNRGELFWTWQSGYKFMRVDLASEARAWSFHLGSTGCASTSAIRAPQRACAQPNLMRVELRGFDPLQEPIKVRADELIRSMQQAGSGACTGAYMHNDACADIFAKTGLDPESGICPDGLCSDQMILRVLSLFADDGGFSTMTSCKSLQLVAASVLVLSIASCDMGGTAFQWQLPEGFPEPRVPEDNPLTIEKVELGRRLFYDTRLSANGTQSCASCHRQANAFSENSSTAVGSTGQKHRRNSMALVNAAYSATFTWAHPGILTLEEHIRIPLFGDAPIEMGAAGHEREILERVAADKQYQRMFADAFPWQWQRINFDNIAKSIASFVRTLISFESPFDRYAYEGEDSALSESQLRGLNLFMSERLECSHCHSGFNFSQFVTHEAALAAERPFHVTGLHFLDEDYAQGFDYGVFDATGDPADKDKFKAPTLRNIEYTAPYMHDGSLATLEEVIDFYAAGGRELTTGPFRGDGRKHPAKSVFVRGFELSEQEKQDVINFLRSLSDESFVTNPAYGDPFGAARR